MSAEGNRFHFVRGNSTSRRAMLIASAAISNAVMLSFMASNAHGQSTFTWTSSSSGNWSTGTNWAGGVAPTVADDSGGDVSLEFKASGTYTANNDLGTYGIFSTTFDAGGGPTTISGGQINLTNPPDEATNPFFINNSTNPVTINNNAVFVATDAQGDGTLEQFVMAPGSTTTFNGTMTLLAGAGVQMTNGQTSGTGGPGGTMIWTQPVTFTNTQPGLGNGDYFPFRIFEGTFEMGGYTIDNGTSDAPIVNINGVNVLQTNGFVPGGSTPNPAVTDMYIGPEDFESGHPNDVASFYLTSAGANFNQPVQIGDAGTITIGGMNTSGTVAFNDFFKTLPADGNGVVNGIVQTYYFSAAAGGTVLQNFALIRGGGSGFCAANVDKVGPGIWIVAGGGTNDTGEQAYHGNTTVRDGTLELAYDDTGVASVTLPAAALSAGAPFYANGLDGGSLGFNDPSNAVQLGDTGTLATDNIALLTLLSSSGPTRQVLHNISVNNFNPNGTTSIGVGDGGIGNFSGTIALSKSVVLASGTGGTANFSGAISGTGGIGTSGTGTVNLSVVNTYNGSTSLSSGSTLDAMVTGSLPNGTNVTNNGNLIINGNETLGSLTGTGTLSLSPATGDTTVKLATNSGLATENGLTIAANSVLDITNNHMIIDYAAGTQATVDSTIRGYLVSGYAGGLLNGTTGITSSTAAATPGFAVGYADGADGVVTGLSSGQLELKYTRYGDANLDGVVSGDDFSILVGNLGKSAAAWDKGDFNYDGVVSGNDFALLVANLGKASNGADVTLPAADLAAIDAFAAANGLMADVPEPASAGLLIVAGLGFMGRRRRSTDRHVAM